jgi:hypothetical protein
MRISWRFLYLATLFYVGVVVAIVAFCVMLCLIRLAWVAVRPW